MDEERLDLRVYWGILRRRWGILVLGVMGAALAAFFMTSAMTPIYVAAAKVFVQGGQNPGVTTAGDIQAGQQLVW